VVVPLPSWSEHEAYASSCGIDSHVSDFANRLCDKPSKTITEILSLYSALFDEYVKTIAQMSGVSADHLRIVFQDTIEHEKKRGGVEYCVYNCRICEPIVNHKLKEITFQNPYPFGNGLSGFLAFKSNCPLERETPYAITNLKIHRVWDENCEEFGKIVYAIAEYEFGKEGKRAVSLHLTLDFESQFLQEVRRNTPKILTKNIKGTEKIWNEGRSLPIASLVTRYLHNPSMLPTVLKGKNREVFKQNLELLLNLKLCELIAATRFLDEEIANKTVKELVDRYGDKELKYLKDACALFA
jgi:hypothetical protein